MESKRKTVGLTKDVGFQVGVRRSFPVSLDTAWDFLFSREGISIWLGEIDPKKFSTKQPFRTTEGIEGNIRVFKPNSHIRMKWRPSHWENNSTLQVRVIPNKTNTTISFHQEHLNSEQQRSEMKIHWTKVLDQLSDKFKDI